MSLTNPFNLFAFIHALGQFYFIFTLQQRNAANLFQVHAHRIINVNAVGYSHRRCNFGFGNFFRFLFSVLIFILRINNIDSLTLQILHHKINRFRRIYRWWKGIVHFTVRKNIAVRFRTGLQFQQFFYRKTCRHQGKQFFTCF